MMRRENVYRQHAMAAWSEARSVVEDTLDKVGSWGTADEATLRMVRDALDDALSAILNDLEEPDADD